MATLPAKHQTSVQSVGAATHVTIYSSNLTAGIVQGTSNTGRLGDSVRLIALKLKGFFQSPSAATGMYSYRVIVGWSGEEYSGNTLGVNLTDTELFLPNTTTAWNVNGIINPKAFTCLYDETFDVPSLISNVADLVSYNQTIQLNQDFDYQASGSALGKTKNLYMVVICNVVGGVAGTTAAGVTYTATDLIFK